MKKVFLLTILLVVAASAAITIEFPDGAPTTVGVPVRVIITSGSATEVDLFVNPGTNTWVYPTEVTLGDDFQFDGDIEITHDGSNLTLFASKGAETGESDPFDVAKGSAAKWQIIAPGQTAYPGNAGNPSGKSPDTVTVTAGDSETYTVNLCDEWYNVVNPNPTGYTVTTDDPFGRINGDNVELRTAGQNWEVTVEGAGYTSNSSTVEVEAGDATQLLIRCEGETLLPGDTLSATSRGGKTGEPTPAFVGVPYPVTVYAVDDAWNTDTNTTRAVFVHGGGPGGVKSDTVDLSGGSAALDSVIFIIAAEAGKNIYSSTLDGALKTEYPTEVIVNRGVLFVEVELEKPIAPIGVHSDLTVTVYEDSTSTMPNFPVNISVLEENLADSVSILDEEWTVYTDEEGIAETEIWASAETTYTIRITAGEVVRDVSFKVQELKELLVRPNPFKAGKPGHDAINFDYKVEQVGEGGASEVVLLIADPFGNLAYKATYGIDQPETEPGTNTITWNGLNSKGNRVASGMYQAVMKITLINGDTQVLKKNFMVIW